MGTHFFIHRYMTLVPLVFLLILFMASNQAVEEEEMGEDQKVVLTAPISLEGGLGDEQYQPPNLLQLIFSMFKNVRPGSDLSKFQVITLEN